MYVKPPKLSSKSTGKENQPINSPHRDPGLLRKKYQSQKLDSWEFQVFLLGSGLIHPAVAVHGIIKMKMLKRWHKEEDASSGKGTVKELHK